LPVALLFSPLNLSEGKAMGKDKGTDAVILYGNSADLIELDDLRNQTKRLLKQGYWIDGIVVGERIGHTELVQDLIEEIEADAKADAEAKTKADAEAEARAERELYDRLKAKYEPC
jgi:hypothetical protein